MDPRKLREALSEAGISGAELARRLGLSRQQVSDWMRGRSDVPRHRRPQVAQALGKPLDYFAEPHPGLLRTLREMVADRQVAERILISVGAEVISPDDIPLDESVRQWMVSEECAATREALDRLGTEIRLGDLETLCSLATTGRRLGKPLSSRAIQVLFEELRQEDLAAAQAGMAQAHARAAAEATGARKSRGG